MTRIKSFIRFCGNIPLICFNLFFLLKVSRTFKVPTCFSVCFPTVVPNREYANLACSIICLWLGGNISSPARHSYWSIFPENNAYIFSACLLIPYCQFSCLILSSIPIIYFNILSRRLFLKPKGLTGASVTKKECGFVIHML